MKERSESMITLVVHYRARPDRVDEVTRCLHELVAATRAEPGCLRYEATQMLDDPTCFLLFEQYVDEDALQQHSSSEHFRRLVVGTLASLLEERVRERFIHL